MSVPLSKPSPTSTVATNPYATPHASLNNSEDIETYNTEPFYSPHGRIGRVRYIAYGILIYLVSLGIAMLIGIFGALLTPLIGNSDALVGLGFGLIIISTSVIQFYGVFVPAKRRLNDLNKTGWMSLILLIPLVSLFFWLYLVFAPGDEGFNDYGAPAEPPSTLMIILAAVMPLTFVAIIGILAAIAIPAYQNYVERAQMEQSVSDIEW